MVISHPCVVSLTWTLKDTQGNLIDELKEPVEFFYGGDDLLAKVEEALEGQAPGYATTLHLEPEHAFGEYRSELVFFEDRSIEVGVAAPSIPFTGFGTAFLDYDNDGWLDIVAANGAVHLIEELLAAPQHANSSWAIGLVTRKDIEIDIELAQVDRPMRSALGTVEHDLRSRRVGRWHQARNICERAGDIRTVRESNEAATVGEIRLQTVEVEPTVIRHGQETEDDPASLGEFLPGNQIAVVFKNRKQDFVAGLKQLSPGIGQQIDRRCRAIGENDFFGRRGVEETRYAGTRLLIGLGRGTCPLVDHFMHVCARLELEATQGAQHNVRHLRSRSAIQVMQARVCQTRKFALEC